MRGRNSVWKRLRRYCAPVLLLALLAAGCRASQPLDDVSETLGADAGKGDVVTFWDDHGGFHGDGSAFLQVQFEDGEFLEAVRQSPDWSPLPLPRTVTALLYGLEEDGCHIGPMVYGEDRSPLLPPVENGYYFFLDRGNKEDGASVLGPPSYNFTAAVYDEDSSTLYYVELDT